MIRKRANPTSVKSSASFRDKLHTIIYEADTPLGKGFDLVLIGLIILSMVLVMLESVESIGIKYRDTFLFLEWTVTIFFTIEYIARILAIKNPKRYIFSFYGIIDLISTLPLYLSYLFGGAQALLALRALRLLRIFRILKLTKFIGEASLIKEALKASKYKILVFLYTVIIVTIILGTVMYLVEPKESGFTSIPRSIYWTIVTLTTVGYGDIAPITTLGQFIASMIMILGYGIIAVPTGIVTVAFSKQREKVEQLHATTIVCPHCNTEGHRGEAVYCFKCGGVLDEI